MGKISSLVCRPYNIRNKIRKTMKLIGILLYPLVYCQDDPELDGRKFSAIMDMAYYKCQAKGTKWTFNKFQARVTNYACHCFIGNSKKAGGRGVPVNDIDDSCRTL